MKPVEKFRIDKVLHYCDKHFQAIGTCLKCGCNEVQIIAAVEQTERFYSEDWPTHTSAYHQNRYSVLCPKCGETYEGL